MAATEQLFNVRERKRFERHDIWERIAENGTISAAVMVIAAIAAVICANTDVYEAIHHFLETPLYVGLGNLTAGLTVELFVNDFLMAIFFLLVGIELKYEMTVGELKNPRQAMLPMLAAVGGGPADDVEDGHSAVPKVRAEAVAADTKAHGDRSFQMGSAPADRCIRLYLV